jgi:hypothetical protein
LTLSWTIVTLRPGNKRNKEESEIWKQHEFEAISLQDKDLKP